MQKALIKKLQYLCITILIIVTCVGCKENKYLIKDYLNDLAFETGLTDSKDIDKSFNALLNWQIISKEDKTIINKQLTYDYLSKTICLFIEKDNQGLEYLKENMWIPKNIIANDDVDKDIALEVIRKACEEINNKHFENKFSYKLKDEKETINPSKVTMEDFEKTFESYELSGEYEIDLNEAEIEFYGDEEEYDDTSYMNNRFQLLSSKTKVINKNGFRISYNFNSSGITARISKDVNDGLNAYFDLSLSNIKPSFKWNYHDNKLESAYFKVSYKSNEKLGVSSGKYKRLYADFKNVDKTNVTSYLSTLLQTKKDKLETSFTLCTIKTPIPNVPTANVCVDVLVNLYASGKAELALANSSELGFEIKNGQFRFIKEIDRDVDFILKATTKATAGINISLQSLNLRLMDIETDFGIQGTLQATLHVYDSNGNIISNKTEETYGALEDVIKEDDEVKLCGDISLNWVLDFKFNTSKSLLYKYGFSYQKALLDEDDQVFGNLHHIENGHFVKKCTRNSKKKIETNKVNVDTNKLTLSKYSIVLKKNNTYEISPSIPSGYTLKEIKYQVINPDIVSLSNNRITALKSGSSKVKIYTSDGKYEIYLNVLVSYE